MANLVYTDSQHYQDIANAIRNKNGTNNTYTPAQMAAAINALDSSGGGSAISVVDTIDIAGGTIRTITAIDISDTTAVASDVATGKYFYTANGTKTAGTASVGGVDIPLFEMVEDVYGNVLSLTCNKTYQECESLLSNQYHLVYTGAIKTAKNISPNQDIVIPAWGDLEQYNNETVLVYYNFNAPENSILYESDGTLSVIDRSN